MDRISKAQRSANMSRIRAKNTTPELVVRRLLHSKGYRYRVHRKDLPGKPDIVFPKLKAVVCVHGCFWHQHATECCRRRAGIPKSNETYWRHKLQTNIERDERNAFEIAALGYRMIVVWECEVADLPDLERRLDAFLDCGSGRG